MTNQVTEARFDQACANLSRFMLMQAARVAKHVGFSYVEAPDAECPSSLRGIQAEWHDCQVNCHAFPISDAGNDTSIYGHAGNVAFRFWHDFVHHDLSLTTKLEDELKATEVHAKAVGRAFGSNSLECRIMRADVAGQASYYFKTGEFVRDQRAFVLDLLQTGAY